MSTSNKILRWMCFLPAGIIAAVLVMFPVHWIVMINLGGWGIDPVIELRDPKSLKNIELFLQSAFGPLAFIYFAARTAPNYRRTCSVILGGIIVIGLPILTYSWNANTISNGGGIMIEHGFARILANIIGAAGAIYLIRSRERKEFSLKSIDDQSGTGPMREAEAREIPANKDGLIEGDLNLA